MTLTDHRDVSTRTVERFEVEVLCSCGEVFSGISHFGALSKQMAHRGRENARADQQE